MADRSDAAWLAGFDRQAGIRAAVVLSGNTSDVGWSDKQQRYVPIPSLVTERLEDRKPGFDAVVVWDRDSGVRHVAADVWKELRSGASKLAELEDPGEDYDVGNTTTHSGTSGRGAACGDTKDPTEFFSVVLRTLAERGRRRYAFVIDLSHYLFGNANSLSDIERSWLMLLSKAVREAPTCLDADSLERPESLVVLLCGRVNAIPPVFFLGNPAVAAIDVPLPDRVERETFVRRNCDRFSVRPALVPGAAAFESFIDLLERFCLRELQQLVKLSRQTRGEPLSPERLVNLYKYGEHRSPWEDLSRARLLGLEAALKERVKGQDYAVAKACKVVIRAYTGLAGLQHSKRQQAPKGVLFFVGPTGVGKTELAKALAQFLFGEEEACVRFDMSEYNHEHSDQRLVGAPPGYVGYEEGGQLTNAIRQRPFSVLLFDEVEKAHPRILDKFLQILEDGRLTDGKGETVYFSETVIIFTSNIGAAEVALSDDEDEVRGIFVSKVQDHFISELRRPELLNRIGDNIVSFNFVIRDDFLVAIAKAKLVPFRERLCEKYRIRDLAFADEDKALRAIVAGIDKTQGGRGVRNALETALVDPLADFLFRDKEDPAHFAGCVIRAVQVGDTAQLVFTTE